MALRSTSCNTNDPCNTIGPWQHPPHHRLTNTGSQHNDTLALLKQGSSTTWWRPSLQQRPLVCATTSTRIIPPSIGVHARNLDAPCYNVYVRNSATPGSQNRQGLQQHDPTMGALALFLTFLGGTWRAWGRVVRGGREDFTMAKEVRRGTV